MVAVELTKGHGAVGLAALGAVILHNYFGACVMKARKQYKVTYPKMYAEGDSAEAKAFNSVQRGHMNYVENLPQYIILQVASSFQYPMASAVLGGTYLLGRLLYFQGYSKTGPKGREAGAVVGVIANLGMLGLGVKFCYDLLVKS
ncbi:unnamed protein product [Pedinophyceae sp. YPF-701]|nr:unnamed protein product [Pedinophyceae sp. YPF-701]